MSGRLLWSIARAVAVLIIAGLCGVGGLVSSASAQPVAWFKYGEEATQAWSFAQIPGDPMQIFVRPRFSAMPSRHIMVLYPRPSSAYDIAITKILQVFAEKDIDAAFTIVNFNNEDARGQVAINFAERDKYDLIFSMGSESTSWLYGHYRDRSIPVISVC